MITFFLKCAKGDLDTIWDGAPPQDVWHSHMSLHTAGSPHTKFEVNVTVCNRHYQRSVRLLGFRHIGTAP